MPGGLFHVILMGIVLKERELRRVFRAAILGASAPMIGFGWTACSQGPDTPDAGDATTADVIQSDVSSDVTDGGISFADVSVDSYVNWCEAGPPVLGASDQICNYYVYVPCGYPEGDYYIDDAGRINRCDQICKGWADYDCPQLDNSYVDVIIPSLDGNIPPQTEAGLWVICECYNGGRRPAGFRRGRGRTSTRLGGYFAEMARLEAASVHAFDRMAMELGALGAPRRLIDETRRAREDETRHADRVEQIATRFGACVKRPRARRYRARSVERMATENAIEGCVRETFGALVATWQAARARDPEVRDAMRVIAEEETRHAALSMRVATFTESKLGVRERARVNRAMKRAIRALREAARTEPHAELVEAAGLPTAREAQSMIATLERELWHATA